MIRALRRRAATALLGALLFAAPGLALAQSDPYPSKPIRLIVPYPPGGVTDLLGRLIAERLSERIGLSVVVDNRGGGSSTIGTGMVANASPDGYTLLLVAPDFAINETLVSKLAYNAAKDFTPVIQVAWSPMVLVTHPSVAASSVREFVDLARAQPGKINFGSGGNGPATAGLLGGQVSAMFLQMAIARPHITAGKLNALATPSGRRSPAMPDLPTLAESGLPGFDVMPWFGVVAPATSPAPIVNRLNTEIAGIMRQPEVRKQLADQGAEPVANTPAEFAAFIQSEIIRWGKVVRESGARIE